MKLSDKGIAILTESEGGHVLEAYLDNAGVPTIGPGMTFYSDDVENDDPVIKYTYRKGQKVRIGDRLSLPQSIALFKKMYEFFESLTDSLTNDSVNQNQFDALVHFVYNTGDQYRTSRLRRLVNNNPNDPQIEREFFRWKISGGKVNDGLIWRRHVEANLYMGRL